MAEVAKLNVFQRLLAVRREVGYVQKDQKKIDGKYTAVMYDDVVIATREALNKHGVIHVVNVKDGWTVEPAQTKSGDPLTRIQCTIQTTFYNADDPNDFVTYSCPSFGLDSGDKGPGKARTYGAKGNLLTALFLLTGDDEESRVEVPGVGKPEPVILTEEEIKSFVDRANATSTKKDLDAVYQEAVKLVKTRKGKASHMVAVTEACSKRAGVIKEANKSPIEKAAKDLDKDIPQ